MGVWVEDTGLAAAPNPGTRPFAFDKHWRLPVNGRWCQSSNAPWYSMANSQRVPRGGCRVPGTALLWPL